MPNTRIDILKEIDFAYWAKVNSVYGNGPIKKNMQTALSALQAKGYLDGMTFKSADGLVEHIRARIQKLLSDNPSSQSDEAFLEIFDLIQVWGGWGGVRGFYTKPKDNPIRESTDDWLGPYKQAALAAKNTRTKALEAFQSIPQMGGSSATRHLYFWGGHPPMSEALQALVFRQDEKADYEGFVSKLVNLTKIWNVDILYAERALYGLTEFYGNLTTLDIHDFNSNDKDFGVVKELLQDKLKKTEDKRKPSTKKNQTEKSTKDTESPERKPPHSAEEKILTLDDLLGGTGYVYNAERSKKPPEHIDYDEEKFPMKPLVETLREHIEKTGGNTKDIKQVDKAGNDFEYVTTWSLGNNEKDALMVIWIDEQLRIITILLFSNFSVQERNITELHVLLSWLNRNDKYGSYCLPPFETSAEFNHVEYRTQLPFKDLPMTEDYLNYIKRAVGHSFADDYPCLKAVAVDGLSAEQALHEIGYREKKSPSESGKSEEETKSRKVTDYQEEEFPVLPLLEVVEQWFMNMTGQEADSSKEGDDYFQFKLNYTIDVSEEQQEHIGLRFDMEEDKRLLTLIFYLNFDVSKDRKLETLDIINALNNLNVIGGYCLFEKPDDDGFRLRFSLPLPFQGLPMTADYLEIMVRNCGNILISDYNTIYNVAVGGQDPKEAIEILMD